MSDISINKEFSNRFAEGLHAVGRCMTYTCSLTLMDGVRVFVLPLKPGTHEQWSTKAKEIAHRILLVFRMLLLLPLNLSIGLIGAGLRALASLARPKFVYIEPRISSILSDGLPKKISFCTYNVAFMPDFISVRNSLPAAQMRLQNIAKTILARDDHIICMQEAFHTKAARDLSDKLKKKYPYIIYNVAPSIFGLNSGLMIASKFPLTNIEFFQHQERGGMDKYANKGMLAATVQVTSKHQLYLFNTHLNGGAENRKEFELGTLIGTGVIKSISGGQFCRKKQLEQAVNKIELYKNARQHDGKQIVGTWFCGDFNIGPIEQRLPEVRINPEWTVNLSTFRGKFTEFYDGFCPPDQFAKKGKDTGTSLLVDDGVSGWNKDKRDDWQFGAECLDHLYVATNPAPAISGTPLIKRDHMNGGSDHLAVRGEYFLLLNFFYSSHNH